VIAIQEILDAYGFKDLWAYGDNEAREQERPKLHHLTHWNHDHTRGVRIDRVYANFAIHSNIKVTTWHHLGSDHREVLYTWSNTPHTKEEPPPRPLPHRAFELKSVREYNKAILTNFMEKHLEGPNAFPKWDKAKRLMCTHIIETWDKKAKIRGK
jgi:hypothetical protein